MLKSQGHKNLHLFLQGRDLNLYLKFSLNQHLLEDKLLLKKIKLQASPHLDQLTTLKLRSKTEKDHEKKAFRRRRSQVFQLHQNNYNKEATQYVFSGFTASNH